MPWKDNGRYSVTNGTFTLIVPYSQKRRGVAEVLNYLNSLVPVRQPAKRVCRDCRGVIGKAHKYTMVEEQPSLYALHHYNCEDPTSYH